MVLHKKSVSDRLLLFLLDEGVFQELTPPHAFVSVDLECPKEEVIGMDRDGDSVEGELFIMTEVSLLFDLLETLPGTDGIIQHYSKHHLEEDDTDRPNISLNGKKDTFKPYDCFERTSGAIVVTVPRMVAFTSAD